MNKKNLAAMLANRGDMSYREAEQAIDQMMEIIQLSISNGLSVSLRGFGTFFMRQRRSRLVTNRHSGEVRRIPDAMIPAFRPSRKLRRVCPRAGAADRDHIL